jgi:hypothetical protein
VDEQRKCAYRYVLYWAMLDIRPLSWLFRDWRRVWNPFCWRQLRRRIGYAGAVAEWLHNLALFAALDFQHFDEDRFWREFESLRSRHSEFGPERYVWLFEQQLAASINSGIAEPI